MLIKPARGILAAAIVTSLVALGAGIYTAANGAQPSGGDTAVDTGLVAQPSGGGQCPPGNPSCHVEDEEGGDDSADDDSGGGEGGEGGGGACTYDTGDGTVVVSDERGRDATSGRDATIRLAQHGVIEIPCVIPGTGWYDGGNCYLGDFPDLTPPPEEPPDGEDEADGQYYYARCFGGVDVVNGRVVFNWQADQRWRWVADADVPTITPEQVAQAWLAEIELYGVQFALAPPAETGAGVVSLPVWLGLESTADTLGPISDEHCIDGVCVSIEAEVAEVTWTLGDGATRTCGAGQHTPWQSGEDFRSPESYDRCHHRYDRSSRHQADGRYEITATSHWEVSWSATSASGELTTERTASTSIQIDEIQVLTTE